MGVLAELHTANKSDSTHSAATAPSIIRAPSKTSPHPTTTTGSFHPLQQHQQQHLHSQTMSFGCHTAPPAAPPPPPPPPLPRPPHQPCGPGGEASWGRPNNGDDDWIPGPYDGAAPGIVPAGGPVENAAVAVTGGKDDCSISPSSATGDAASDGGGGGGGAQASPPPLCAGCRLRIVDKFYLSAVERKWHSSCLKCAECGVELEGQLSCYERNGHIFCKEDYLRIYAQRSRQCSRCLLDIQASDLVMKARHCIFHLDCFRCANCDVVLRKGDLFGMFDDVLYCRAHFEHMNQQQAAALGLPLPPGGSAGQPGGLQHPPPPANLAEQPEMFPTFPAGPYLPGAGGHHFEPGWCPPPGGGGGGVEFPSPMTATGPGSASPAGDFAFENNNHVEPLKKRRGRKKRKVESFAAAMNGYMEGGFSGGLHDGPGGSKTKRARTSFKHHQLRIMKAHFQINQNPDSRELKMLSQKTCLDKKVLQVWFQNARAKWRRVNSQGGGQTSSGGSSGAGMGADPGGVMGLGGGGGGAGLGLDVLSEENCDSDSMPLRDCEN